MGPFKRIYIGMCSFLFYLGLFSCLWLNLPPILELLSTIHRWIRWLGSAWSEMRRWRSLQHLLPSLQGDRRNRSLGTRRLKLWFIKVNYFFFFPFWVIYYYAFAQLSNWKQMVEEFALHVDEKDWNYFSSPWHFVYSFLKPKWLIFP